MTGPTIPSELWPEGAVALVWSAFGFGKWVVADDESGTWLMKRANLPMPAGHDWRVPAMRPQPALAIDLEQFQELLSHWKNSEYPLSYEGQHSQRALNACIADLQALIDGSRPPHPDDAAVDAFAAALKAKLSDARDKGRGGWAGDEPGMQQRLSDMLREHVAKGDPRDVAAFCMFLHQRGEGIAPLIDASPRGGSNTVVLPAGWRVIPHSSSWREGERWEVYGPHGGGSISTEEIQEPVVRDLLDALAGIKPAKGEGEK